MASKSGKSSVNTFSGGLNLDIDKSLLKENQYRYAENVRTITNEGSTTGALTNIEGSLYMDSISFATGETIIASHTVRDFGVLFTVLASGLNKIYRLVFKADGTLDTTTTVSGLYIGTKNVLATNGIELNLNINDAISIVSRYEDDDNIKVYWADGKNFIRSINIAPSNDAQNASVTLSSTFDIIPSGDLKVPVIASIGSGRLNAGIVQYFYQLYGPSGTETMLSPGSAPVNITASEIQDKSIKYLGTGIGETYGKPAGKSVKVGVVLPTNNTFNRVKLISVYYYDYAEVPVINIVKELAISDSAAGTIYIEDSGVSVVGELTQAEFNLIGGNLFIPNYIESKDNILFAANIKEDTWDIDDSVYDTRSYQFGYRELSFDKTIIDRTGQYTFTIDNSTNIVEEGDIVDGDTAAILSIVGVNPATITLSGTISATDGDIVTFKRMSTDLNGVLYNSDGSSNYYTPDDIATIPATDDAIHKEIYTAERYADIVDKYDKDGNLGGSGLNIDYLFTNTYFIESYGDYWGASPGISTPSTITDKYIDRRTARIGDIKRNLSDIRLFSSDGNELEVPLSDFGLSDHEGPLNYANPYLANVLKSYQRDEIYRFAAVFYDDKGRKSPAHWIADVRFPAGYEQNSTWNSSIFDMPTETINLGFSTDTILTSQELLVKPLGITFTFKNLNLIPDVKRIEIVRAKRDINNKTIYAQGVVQKVGTLRVHDAYTSGDHYDLDEGITNTLRPHPIVSMGHSYSIAAPNFDSDVNKENVSTQNTTISFDRYCSTGGPSMYSDAKNDDIFLKQYVNDSTSPYFYNKNFLLFVNPETSFYGVDFSESLKNATISPIIDIVDITSPVTTPPVINAAGSTFGDSYYGDFRHNLMQFKPTGSAQVYFLGFYTAADINNNNKAHDTTVNTTNTLITDGFAGADFGAIAQVNGFKTTRLNNSIPNSSNFDIYNPVSGSWDELINRTYISLGGVIMYKDTQVDAYHYNNGFAGLDGAIGDYPNDNSTPSILNSNANDSSRRALTFKLFDRYFEAADEFTIGGREISLVTQNTNIYTDIDNYTTANISTKSDVYKLSKKIKSFEYSGDLSGGIKYLDIPGSDYISIGGAQYLNLTKPLTSGDGAFIGSTGPAYATANSNASGLHGSGIILNFDNEEQLPTIGRIDKFNKKYDTGEIGANFRQLDNIIAGGLSTYITNIKSMNESIYGGNSLIDRQFTEYISTGANIDVVGNSTKEFTVFGGDTFLGIFDYTVNHATDPNEDYTNDLITGYGVSLLHQAKHVGIMVPLESSINLHLTNGKSFVASNNNIAIQKEPGVYSPGASAGGTWSVTQDLPQFDYNAAYSAEQTAVGSIAKLLITESDNTFDCRVYSSEPKTNDELYDKWATFKVANYIDVDTQFGEITGLKKFNDKLMFWQKNAFGVLSVNERSLIKDNNISALTLGTGGILTRFDYITTANGFRKGMIGAVAESEGNLYWMDADNAELCIFNGSVSPLSKAKGIQTFFNKNKDNIQNHIPMIFDKKYNEIILTLNGLEGAVDII